MRTAVVTGATGLLGSHFLLNFLGDRLDHAYVLVRGDSEDFRMARVRGALNEANHSYPGRRDLDELIARLTTVEADIEAPLAGIAGRDLEAIRRAGASELWHFAASLNFEDRRVADIEAANIAGVQHIFDVATALAIDKLFHFSTAYTCGTRTGEIPAVLHPQDGPFSNHYERTKCYGERYLAENCPPAGIKLTVLRPSVVIGNSVTKRPGGSSSGLYGFLREISHIVEPLRSSPTPVRIHALLNASINFVPVDVLMDQVKQLLTERDCNGIHHLVSAGGPPNSTLLTLVNDAFGIADRIEATDSPVVESTPLERLFDGRLEFYRSYFRADRTFVPSVGQRHVVSPDDMRLYLKGGMSAINRTDIASAFDCTTVVASDGAPLNVYAIGPVGAPVILICNAAGMPAEFVRPLAERLGGSCRVITWESRGLPSHYPVSEAFDYSLDRQACDGLEVLNHFDAGGAIITGWCAGARLALRIASILRTDAAGLVLMNGSYNLDAEEYTRVEHNMAGTMPHLATSRQHAEAFYRALFQRPDYNAQSERGVVVSSAPAELADAVYSANSDDIHLANLPFQSSENLYRYACLMTTYIETPLELVGLPDVPSLVLTCERDLTANPRSSHRIAEAMDAAELVCLPDGDHFSVHWDSQYGRWVEDFVSRCSNTEGAGCAAGND